MAIFNIRKTRLKKLEAIKEEGFNPYPSKAKRTHTIEEVLNGFESLLASNGRISITGRIKSIREHGGSTFIHLEDETEKIQAYFKQDKLGEKEYKYFLNNFDVGDFIEIEGILFKTKRGEKTIEVSGFKILAKSFLPLPEKWHGLKDVEERFRKRYLDLIMNPETRKIFKTRSKIIEELRRILRESKFMEVETPVLQPIPGGAFAKPFKTYLNAMKLDLYLRVSPELYLKRLLVGGFEKIYEIGKCFRNEGMDKYHNPDFTMLELYWAYQDRDGLMDFTENLITTLLDKTTGSKEITYQGQSINFKTPWFRISFTDLIKKYCQIDIKEIPESELKKKLSGLGVKIEKGAGREEILDELYKKACRPNLLQPTFIVDHPVGMAVLAKAKEENPRLADRFQLVAGGIELINGFSELNNPIEQKKRFKDSKIALERRDDDFLEALEYGMPPAAGLGIGIDRLAMLITDSASLREIILFPTMRPKNK